jgi:hypothetical protein
MKEDPLNSSAERSSPSSPGRDSALSMMSAWELADHYNQAISNSHDGDRSSDQYALELFRRAAWQGDQEAWEVVQGCFREKVRGWVRQHPRSEAVCCLNSEEHYVALAFARCRLSTTAQQLEFGQLSALLQYLRICLNAVMLDALRTYSHLQEVSLREPVEPEEPQVEGGTDSEEVWKLLTALLPNEREQRLAYLLFHCGLKPKNVVQIYPREFNDVREISRLRCSIIERFLDHVNLPIEPIDPIREARNTTARVQPRSGGKGEE